MANKTTIKKDKTSKKILVTREFDAPVEKVWKAWTDSSILDKWWAPKPWRAETKEMNFKEAGHWLYCMVGPEGERQWCRLDYKTIVPGKMYTAIDAFCDEAGKPTGELPGMQWKNEFASNGNTTTVTVEISFETVKDLETIVEMGFEEGFTMAHGNLDEVLAGK